MTNSQAAQNQNLKQNKKNQAYRFIRRFGALFRTRTILGFTRACCKWMLRAESSTKRLKIFNFSRAYNHHVIFKQPLKNEAKLTSSRLKFHALSPAIFASCRDQSFSFQTKRGYKVNSQAYQSIVSYGGFQSGARLSGEAAKTLIYFAQPTKTAMLRWLHFRGLRKPFRYS